MVLLSQKIRDLGYDVKNVLMEHDIGRYVEYPSDIIKV